MWELAEVLSLEEGGSQEKWVRFRAEVEVLEILQMLSLSLYGGNEVI